MIRTQPVRRVLVLWTIAAMLMMLLGPAVSVVAMHEGNTTPLLYGYVKDSSGTPVAGANVRYCWDGAAAPDPETCTFSSTAITDGFGHYWLASPVPGHYVFWAVKDGNASPYVTHFYETVNPRASLADLILPTGSGGGGGGGGSGGSVPAAPSPPIPSPSPSVTTIWLQWTDNASNETSYVVERRPSGATNWSVLSSSLSQNTTTYADTTPATNTAYDYRVKACNASGCSGYGSLFQIMTDSDDNPPVAPMNGTIAGTVMVAASAGGTATPASGIQVKIKKLNSSGTEVYCCYETTTGTAGTWSITGLSTDSTYGYRVFLPAYANIPAQNRTFPSSSSQVDGVNFTLPAPDEDETDKGTVDGFIKLTNGSPAAGVHVDVFAFRENTFMFANTDSSAGTFSFELDPGIWTIGYEILTDGYVPVGASSVGATIAAGVTTTVQFSIQQEGTALTVLVQRPDGTTLPGAGVVASRYATQGTSAGTGTQSASGGIESDRIKETGTDGKATFLLGAGTWYLRVFSPNTSLLSPPEKTVAITNGVAQNATMQFRTRTAVIEGFTLNADTGLPVDAYVSAWSDDGAAASARAGADGAYRLNVLPNQTWYVRAGANVNGVVYKSRVVDVAVGESALRQNLLLKRSDFAIPPPADTTVVTTDATSLLLQNNVAFSCGASCFSASGNITVQVLPELEAPDQGGTQVIGLAYKITATSVSDGSAITSLAVPATVQIPYTDGDLSGTNANAADLKIGFYNETLGTWERLASVVDTQTKTVSASVTHLTRFALLTPAYAAVVNPTIKEGDLIRGPDGQKVWIVSAHGFKRHIFNPDVFGMYGHFIWNNIHDISQSTLDAYSTSDLYRAAGDARVFSLEEIDEAAGLARKRWLDMTPEKFIQQGYDWLQVFEINAVERDYYQEGIPIS